MRSGLAKGVGRYGVPSAMLGAVALLAGTAGSVSPASSGLVEVTVIVENLAPQRGIWLTPVWVGFHDGSFDVYDRGEPASIELEALAEDGDTEPLTHLFAASQAGSIQGTIVSGGSIPQIAPGQRVEMKFVLDGNDLSNRFFSYASMVIPSNDAFVANGEGRAHQVFRNDGSFKGAEFVVAGIHVQDAGSELNDETPEHTAFFGQMSPDSGLHEGVGVRAHGGLKFAGSGGILDDPDFKEADFTFPGYRVARITVVAGHGDDGGR